MINLNAELFNRYKNEDSKPLLVEFQAPWCVYCRRIASAMNKVSEQYADTLVVGQVDIDEEPDLAAREQIELVPTLVLYRNGQVLGSVTAPGSKAAIDAFIQNTLNS